MSMNSLSSRFLGFYAWMCSVMSGMIFSKGKLLSPIPGRRLLRHEIALIPIRVSPMVPHVDRQAHGLKPGIALLYDIYGKKEQTQVLRLLQGYLYTGPDYGQVRQVVWTWGHTHVMLSTTTN